MTTKKQLDANTKAIIYINNGNICVNIIKKKFKWLPCLLNICFTRHKLSHFHCAIVDDMPDDLKSGYHNPFTGCSYYRKEDFNLVEIINEKYKEIRKKQKLENEIKASII